MTSRARHFAAVLSNKKQNVTTEGAKPVLLCLVLVAKYGLPIPKVIGIKSMQNNPCICPL